MRTFTVTAIWDPEASVFYSETDVPGLAVEAETLDEFVDLVRELAPMMVRDNLPDLTGGFTVRFEARRDMELSPA